MHKISFNLQFAGGIVTLTEFGVFLVENIVFISNMHYLLSQATNELLKESIGTPKHLSALSWFYEITTATKPYFQPSTIRVYH